MKIAARTELLVTLLATALAGGLAAAPQAASGAVRHASPASSTVTGDCTASPCRLDRALAVAVDGDDVVLSAGSTYVVDYLARATTAVTVRPASPGERPRLVGAAGLASPTLALADGGTVTGLDLETSSDAAVELAGGARGIGLRTKAGPGAATAARLLSAPNPTALISSVAHDLTGNTAVEVLDPTTGAGGASLVNVTAVSSAGNSWGVTTELATQSPVLKNVIAIATSKDLHGRSGSKPIAVSSSIFRPQSSANYVEGAANRKDVDVAFVDEAAGDFRLAPGSVAIDAGAEDALSAGSMDPAGVLRRAGSTPDIGGYEFATGGVGVGQSGDSGAGGDATTGEDAAGDGTATGSGTATTSSGPADASPGAPAAPGPLPLALPAVGTPALAESVGVDVVAGTVLVRPPGAAGFVPVRAESLVAVGSTIDVRSGRIALTSVREGGRVQTGEFWGGRFIARQTAGRIPYTELVLTGGSFAGCPRAATKRAVARAAGRRRGEGRVVRSLWGKDDKGRFRTRGRSSVATVRGTHWLVEDRCDGTRTVVRQGAVFVQPTRGRGKLVRAGSAFLARRAGR